MEINTRLLSKIINLLTVIEMVKSDGVRKEKALTFLTEQIKVREEEIKLLQMLFQKKALEDEVQ